MKLGFNLNFKACIISTITKVTFWEEPTSKLIKRFYGRSRV